MLKLGIVMQTGTVGHLDPKLASGSSTVRYNFIVKGKILPHYYFLDSITDSMDMNRSKLQEIVMDWGGWHVAVHGIRKSPT